MINSILQFKEKGVKKLEKIFTNFYENPTNFAEMINGVNGCVLELACSMIEEQLTEMDEMIRNSSARKENWQIVKRDNATLLTVLGTVKYSKTLFINKKTGERTYLLDRIMGIDKHTRITEDAEAKILEEAVESSYRKGGENACLTKEKVSKSTVKNKIHTLEFPKTEPLKNKKRVPYLYIDADEDHVALQFFEKKGDIKSKYYNKIMPKMIYIYEGVDISGKRHSLINPKYFGGLYEGSKGVEELWKEVWDYIEASYDTENIKKIYINGDGANWIKSGAKYIAGSHFVLDSFHLSKYITGSTIHLGDMAEACRNEIYSAINSKNKGKVKEIFDNIIYITEKESKRKSVIAAKDYIIKNWTGIMEQAENPNVNLQCSAEGHISHIFADRMSSRPLGWSKIGVDKMSRLRIYSFNGGNMLELVRYQKKALKKVVGADERIYSAKDILKWERKRKSDLGSLAGTKIYSIPYENIKKKVAIKNQIWGL